ncbi:2891_t:CDS:2 [Entrophospora sp. SA101]|nr:8698_t:CDS:2 [Entrophospora candida]CAJ0639870.1 2891_t:CDS:2 [Entrophospora sp. SA101]CAJ0823249.1 10808_t:CDS:2 [Entrophospora sp. SA101]CAJ0847489.1 17654_t:CDS:2 [Entrophospora sp. SA101]CAJ0921484.1 6460_t:CDS:2 [Entrophospora sp. SA101]
MLSFIRRSIEVAKEEGTKILRANPIPWDKEMKMLKLNDQEDLGQWLVGSDKDIGGLSEAKLEITPENKGRFHGYVSLDLPPNYKYEKSGYAAIRSKVRGVTIFGTPMWDTTLFRYLALRVKGDYKKYYINLQTDGPVQTDLFQHRLFLRKPGDWETVMIPFRDFILTNHGIIQEPQIAMYREKVKTVGISILDQHGPFSIEIDWIKAMNTDTTDGDFDMLPRNREKPASE